MDNPVSADNLFSAGDLAISGIEKELKSDLLNEKYVVFSLGNDEYGISIKAVQEIVSTSCITRIPGVSEHVSGLMNLRGNIVPVFRLRSFFQIEGQSDSSVILILQDTGERGKKMGLIVDKVSDVVTLEIEDGEQSNNLGAGLNMSFIESISRYEDRLVLVIDIGNFMKNQIE